MNRAVTEGQFSPFIPHDDLDALLAKARAKARSSTSRLSQPRHPPLATELLTVHVPLVPMSPVRHEHLASAVTNNAIIAVLELCPSLIPGAASSRPGRPGCAPSMGRNR